MWKQLHSNLSVHPGDQIRYVGNSSFTNDDTLYQVTKADQFYFEMAPAETHADITQYRHTKRIVKYFDIGYYIGLEVWREE